MWLARCLLLCWAALCLGCKPAAPVTTVELRVAAAADLQFALPEIAATFERANPGAKVSITLGSSGNFFAQIENGAQFDLFLSADERLPGKLIADGHAVAGADFAYAQGRLVVWVSKSSTLDLDTAGLGVLTEPSVKKVAIANPAHAPYGAAAEAALKNSGTYEAVAGKLVLGENIAQAAQFAESGAVDAGLLALSLAQAPKMTAAGRSWVVPAELYPPLLQRGVVLKGSAHPEIAARFREALGAKEARAILQRYGFLLPAENR